MKRILKLAIITSLFLLIVGCASVLVPYHDEPLCKKGATGGYCGSVTEVYNAVTGEMDRKTDPERLTKMGASK